MASFGCGGNVLSLSFLEGTLWLCPMKICVASQRGNDANTQGKKPKKSEPLVWQGVHSSNKTMDGSLAGVRSKST